MAGAGKCSREVWQGRSVMVKERDGNGRGAGGVFKERNLVVKKERGKRQGEESEQGTLARE